MSLENVYMHKGEEEEELAAKELARRGSFRSPSQVQPPLVCNCSDRVLRENEKLGLGAPFRPASGPEQQFKSEARRVSIGAPFASEHKF